MMNNNKNRKSHILLWIVGITIVLNLLFIPRRFCDVYADHVYPIINLVIGSLTSWCPVAIGEIIMYLAGILLLLFILSSILLIFLRKKEGYRRYYTVISRWVVTLVVITGLVYTTNWIIPFRSHLITVSDNDRESYSISEVAEVRNMIVQEINELAMVVPRDEAGHLMYDYTMDDIYSALLAGGDRFPRLKGHYSRPKTALCSDFLEWMSIGGYNYIYTMEPTINKYCDKLYTIELVAHELCHHKGYYLENEAEFLSTVLLSESSNPVLRYSGLIQMYWYIDDDLKRKMIINQIPKEMYEQYPGLSSAVLEDIRYSEEQRDIYYTENVNHFMEDNLKDITAEVGNKGWEIQADVLQDNIYDGMTLLILQYYIPN